MFIYFNVAHTKDSCDFRVEHLSKGESPSSPPYMSFRGGKMLNGSRFGIGSRTSTDALVEKV